MAARGTPEFYRDQAIRLALAAIEVTDPAIRLHLLEMADSFQKLAERVGMIAGNRDVPQFPQQERQRKSA